MGEGGAQRPNTLGPSPLALCLVILPRRPHRPWDGQASPPALSRPLHPAPPQAPDWGSQGPCPACSCPVGEQDAKAWAESDTARPRRVPTPPASSPSAACQGPCAPGRGTGHCGRLVPCRRALPGPQHPTQFPEIIAVAASSPPLLPVRGELAVQGCEGLSTAGGALPAPRAKPTPVVQGLCTGPSSWTRASGIRVLSITHPSDIERAGERPPGWFRLCKA